MDAMREEMIAHCHHHEIHIPSWKLSQEARMLWPEKPAEHWYVDTYVPGRLLTPMLAEDRFAPTGAHWVRQIATYTFADLLAKNFMHCTLTQILQAWFSIHDSRSIVAGHTHAFRHPAAANARQTHR